jgi:hypothetical protein
MNSITAIIQIWYDKRSEERQREREHEIALRELENQQIREAETCTSCEALKLELARLHDQNNSLIAGILHKPTEEQPIDTTELKPIKPRSMPWGVRRGLLEEADRNKAKILREQQRESQQTTPAVTFSPVASASIDELEKELGVINGN